MTFRFYLRTQMPPSMHSVVHAVGMPGMVCVQGTPSNGLWDRDVFYTFYLPTLSTRGVQVHFDDGLFEVCIASCSSPEDYDLAFKFIEAIARLSGSAVEVDGGAAFQGRELRGKYNDDWMQDQIRQTCDYIFKLLVEHGRVEVMGPVRPFILGHRFAKELDSAGPSDARPQRVLQAIRAVQYIDRDKYNMPTVMQVEKDGHAINITVWSSPDACLLPSVSYVSLAPDRQRNRYLVPDSVPKLVGSKFRWLDEEQGLIEALSEAEWRRVWSTSRKYEVIPSPEGPIVLRPWWQFWKRSSTLPIS